MRKASVFFGVVSCLMLATAAFASGGVTVDDGSGQKTFTNCSSSGSSAQTLTARTYLLTVADETTFICTAVSGSTCSSGGTMYPAGTAIKLALRPDQVSVSCRSASSGGDAQFSPAD